MTVSAEDFELLRKACEEKVGWASRLGASFTPSQIHQMVEEVYRNTSDDCHNGHTGYGDGGGIDQAVAGKFVEDEIQRLIDFLQLK